MSLFCCDRKDSCISIAVVASIVLGIIAAFLQLTAAITVTPAFLWVVFGIAVVYLAVALIASALMRGAPSAGCVCTVLTALLVGILGTILLSVILLAITFAATSILGAVIVGGLVLFFSLTVSATACFVRCLMHCND